MHFFLLERASVLNSIRRHSCSKSCIWERKLKTYGQSKILVYSIQGRIEIFQRETLRVYSNIYTNLTAWCFTEEVEFLYLDSVCIRFIHILQTFTALESWSLLRAVLQLCGLTFNKKIYTLHWKLLGQSKPAMRFSAAVLHLITSSIILEELSVRGVPQPSIVAWQLVKVSSKPAQQSYNKVTTEWELNRLTRGSASITWVCC